MIGKVKPGPKDWREQRVKRSEAYGQTAYEVPEHGDIPQHLIDAEERRAARERRTPAR